MTDSGQGGGRAPESGAPPTPGEQQAAPARPPAAPAGAPPPGPPPGTIPPSTFPGQDSATMRVMPTYNPAPPAPPPPPHPSPATTGERHIGKYVVKRELGRGG